MSTRRIAAGIKYSLCAGLVALGLAAWTNVAAAQTISAGTVDGTAGQTVDVPITIDTASANVAFFAVTFTVVPQNGAPAITDKLDYVASDALVALGQGPDLKTAVQAQAKLAIGYAGVTIDPPLSGSVAVGTLKVPIPAGATGSYQVQLSKPSAGDSSGNKVTLTASNGAVNLAGGPEPTPTTPPPPGPDTINGGSVSGMGGQTASVPIVINTGTDNVAFFAVTFTVVPQNGAPAITDKLDYMASAALLALGQGPDLKTAVQAQAKLAIGYAGVTIDPPLSGTVEVGTLLVPIPAGATGSYDVQLSKPSAGDSSGNKVTLTATDGTISLGTVVEGTETPTPQVAVTDTPVPATATNTPIPVVNTSTPTATNAPPTATATAIKIATATPTKTATSPPSSGGFEEEGGCEIGTAGTRSSGWLLLIPAIGLLIMRRRSR